MLENATIYINEKQIINNYKILKQELNPDRKIIAVIKANGYGCDLIKSAKLCHKMGIDVLAVLSIDQAIEIRQSGIEMPILLLGSTLKSNFKYLIEFDIIQVTIDFEYAKELSKFALKNNTKIKTHIKADTGLNRLGYKNYEEIKETYSLNGLDVQGIYSHFVESQSNKEEDLEFSKLQIKRFDEVLTQLKTDGIDPKMTHLQNSPSIINFGDLNYTAVRCGMILFGLFHPSQRKKALDKGYKPVIQMRARVAMVKEIKKDEYVGYGRNFKATSDMKIATVSSGYVDGVMKDLSLNDGFVVFGREKCRILGDIAMSQFMIDVTNLDIKEEDEVLIFGNDIQDIYNYITYTNQTINELISHLRYSIPRIYID